MHVLSLHMSAYARRPRMRLIRLHRRALLLTTMITPLALIGREMFR
jgi:hypothetical protein